MSEKIRVVPSSGNVFADIGVYDADEAHAKAEIVTRICSIINERKLNQRSAAKILGIDQPKVSALMHGRLDGFSSDRLFKFLNILDRDIEIVIKPKKQGAEQGRISVIAS
jgi:predicted XRE-type DNA-binding protein